MAQSDPVPLDLPPGYVKNESSLSASGRYVDGNQVRFVRGKPEKIGGYSARTATAVVGYARGAHAWNDLTSRQLIALGTARKLYAIPNTDFMPVDITPYATQATLGADPFVTAAASADIVLTYPAHGLIVGQVFYLSGATLVGGLDLNGTWAVKSVTDVNTIVFTAAANASGAYLGGGTVVAIKVELAPGLEDPGIGFGFGVGGFGASTFGTPRDFSNITFDIRAWSLSNFGKLLLASPSDAGKLHSWDPTITPIPRASVVANAPSSMLGHYVTAERIVVALGTDGDPMQIDACAQGDFNDWDFTLTKGAAGLGPPAIRRRLGFGRRLIAGADLGNTVSLIWSDSAVYTAQYTGSQFVLATKVAGLKCGLVGAHAFTVANSTAYWFSDSKFFMFAGGLQEIPNQEDITGWLLPQLRPYFTTKTVAYYDAQFGEVWFGFVLNLDAEPSFWAVYNTRGQFWFHTEMDRTAATQLDGNDSRPILAGTDGLLYVHNDGLDGAGEELPWRLATSAIELAGGKVLSDIDGFAPDMSRQQGTVSATIVATDRTKPAEEQVEAETLTFERTEGLVDFRISGRQMSLELSGDGMGCDFRLGSPRILIKANGAKR